MPHTIHILSEETINLIAAGEVIEHPASVVKELVENAVDAEASRIIVKIQEGGFQDICVSDNGKGMSREDLLLCLERHATSKIRLADDLSSIFSMGFRGEALASIAAISKIRISSGQKEEAYEIYAEGGKIKSCEPIARNSGTTVHVNSLFYNVPARRKFQKSAQSSQNEIMKMLTKLALAHPFIEMKCLANEREIFSTFMKRDEEKELMTKQVIEKVLGEAFLNGASQVRFQNKGCFLLGFIGAPHQTRKNRLGQYLFVNGRAVNSTEISHAIYEGYGTRLPSNEHPTFVLYLTLPSEWIDVNVHPQKKEIRLHEVRQIKQFIRSGIFKALQGEIPNAVKTDHICAEAPSSVSWASQAEPAFQLREEEMKVPELPTQELPIIGLYAHYLILDANRMKLSICGSQGILLIDLQAAKARITFESILDLFKQKGEMQTLLFPLTFECAAHEKGQIEQHLTTLQQLGIAICPFGEKTFAIDALDPHLEESQAEALVYELIQVLEQFGDAQHLIKDQQKKLALSMLRFARSQVAAYTLDQARAIVKELFSLSSPYQGPTGKPTCIYISQDEIEKYFR